MMNLKIKDSKELGLAIRERRLAMGLDQGELAAKIGVSRLWVNEIEKGKPRAAVGLVLRALNALDISFLLDDQTIEDASAGFEAIDIDAIIDDAKERR
ncbi:MAG: helix-turn-helix domain-containing protein [Pseudomonadota bacterium]